VGAATAPTAKSNEMACENFILAEEFGNWNVVYVGL
jgi:hypothetical protein